MSKLCTLFSVICAVCAMLSLGRPQQASGCALTGLLWLLLGRIAKQEWPGAD